MIHRMKEPSISAGAGGFTAGVAGCSAGGAAGGD